MASVKVKFRPSTVVDKEGTIYYQVIHNRVIRQIKTDYRVFREEWNEKSGVVILSANGRTDILRSIKERIGWDLKRLKAIIGRMENSGNVFTADSIVEEYQEATREQSFFRFMEGVIVRLKLLNKERTAENYAATLKSFMRFREDSDVLLDEFSSDLMMEYEAYMKAQDITMNTVSFYMRILRAVYNRAVEKGLTEQRNPFRHVYTGIDKTVKRAIPLKAIKQIKELDLSMNPSLEFARDMFLFSFYTRGMSFIDMAYLKKSDLKNGILTYRRRKTGQQLTIKWEKCMEEIVTKYEDRSATQYMLPIITSPFANERVQYRNALYRVNTALKEVARLVNISIPLTMYCARHGWANIAKSKNIPLSVISEGMGHDSEETTRIYLASLDTSVVDRANSLILKDL